MTEIARLARFRIDPSRRDEILAAYADYAEAVGAEAGMQVWEMCTGADDQDVVWLFVRATAAAALDARRLSDASARLGAVLMPAIIGDPQFHDLLPHFSSR